MGHRTFLQCFESPELCARAGTELPVGRDDDVDDDVVAEMEEIEDTVERACSSAMSGKNQQSEAAFHPLWRVPR